MNPEGPINIPAFSPGRYSDTLYAGLAHFHRYAQDSSYYHLLAYPEAAPNCMDWDAARAWAQAQSSGASLANPRELQVMGANLGHILKPGTYWTGVEVDEDPDCAWAWNSPAGGLVAIPKTSLCYAQAVRRLPLDYAQKYQDA